MGDLILCNNIMECGKIEMGRKCDKKSKKHLENKKRFPNFASGRDKNPLPQN